MDVDCNDEDISCESKIIFLEYTLFFFPKTHTQTSYNPRWEAHIVLFHVISASPHNSMQNMGMNSASFRK